VKRPLVFKLGGELIETAASLARLAAVVRDLAAVRPVVVVHGGGRAIDAELARRGVVPRKVDGLRITDAPTLDVAVAVLAGQANTALVAALVSAGVAAVGLTGVDAGLARARRSLHRAASGEVVDLGCVGDPDRVDPSLVRTLVSAGFVPVIASLGVEAGTGGLLNINADVMACRVAAALSSDLVIAGATPGVLDASGRTIPAMDRGAIAEAITGGTATAGMIAKLAACRDALDSGVGSVRLIDGRALDRGVDLDQAPGTGLVAGALTSA
jgi:acetylglutamate kinase